MSLPTMASWDEAWYGSIAQEIVKSGDIFHLNWNGAPFYDHPPMGMWFMALSYKLFGVSEFSSRLPSVLFGMGSVILLYFTGFILFKKKEVGFAAALILGTSVWYTIRVRSGNLDSPFVFFYMLTVFSSLMSLKNIRYFILVGISLACLIMTKTTVGFSAIPLAIFVLLPTLKDLKKNWMWFLLGSIVFSLIVFPWYRIQFNTYPDFYYRHFVNIGTRNKDFASYFKLDYSLPLFYLHMGIRKWYYLWLISFAYLILFFRFLKKNVFIIIFWNILVLYPFLTTDQTHIWHLIPVYLPVSLVVAYGFWEMGSRAVLLLKNIVKKFSKKADSLIIFDKRFVSIIYVVAFMFLALVQTKIFYNEVIPKTRDNSDQVDISKKLSKYDEKIYLDDDFLPIAVFYSGKKINQVSTVPEEDKKTLVGIFSSDENKFVVATRNWALDGLDDKNIPYEVLEANGSFSVVSRPHDKSNEK